MSYPTGDGYCYPTIDRKRDEQSSGPFHGIGGGGPFVTIPIVHTPINDQRMRGGVFFLPSGGMELII